MVPIIAPLYGFLHINSLPDYAEVLDERNADFAVVPKQNLFDEVLQPKRLVFECT